MTIVKDLGTGLAAIPDIPYQLLTNPQGVIWGILYGPFQFGSDLLHGMACGDPERLAMRRPRTGCLCSRGSRRSKDRPSTQRTSHSPPRKGGAGW